MYHDDDEENYLCSIKIRIRSHILSVHACELETSLVRWNGEVCNCYTFNWMKLSENYCSKFFLEFTTFLFGGVISHEVVQLTLKANVSHSNMMMSNALWLSNGSLNIFIKQITSQIEDCWMQSKERDFYCHTNCHVSHTKPQTRRRNGTRKRRRMCCAMHKVFFWWFHGFSIFHSEYLIHLKMKEKNYDKKIPICW